MTVASNRIHPGFGFTWLWEDDPRGRLGAPEPVSGDMAAGILGVFNDNLSGQEDSFARLMLENIAGARVETQLELKVVIES